MQDDGPKDAQQEAQQDSGLQTPQPDQPHPPVSETAEDSPPREDDDRPDDAAEDSQPLEGGDAADAPPIDVDVNVGNTGEGNES